MPPTIPTIGQMADIFSNVLTIAIALAGVTVFGMLLVGGFMYLSAGGDKEAAQKASKTITFAIGGLVVLLSTWLILTLVFRFLGFDGIPDFNLCLPGFSGPNCT
jgi:hypothetical protein